MRSRPMTNHGFKGGYTTVKNYVREQGRRSREMFVPLAHATGHAQADFGEAMVVIGGVEQKAHFFALDLPHSDTCFVRAYPAAVSEAWVGRPGKGNDKGAVEGLVGYASLNFIGPQLHGAHPPLCDVRYPEPLAGGAMPQASGRCLARASGQHRATSGA